MYQNKKKVALSNEILSLQKEYEESDYSKELKNISTYEPERMTIKPLVPPPDVKYNKSDNLKLTRKINYKK